jgi:sec-independent protein translocase protein TatA
MNTIMNLAGVFNPANIGMPELVILLAIVLVIFGPKKLPGLGKAIGKSIREFKDGMRGLGNVLEEEDDDSDYPPKAKGDLDPKPVARAEEADKPPVPEPAKEPSS